MTTENENNVDAALEAKLEEFFPEEAEETPEVEDVKTESEPKEVEETEEAAEEEEEVAEDENETIEEEEDIELNRKLSGHPKEFKDFVKSIKDKKLQGDIFNAGKIYRAENDRVRLELGNLKKEYSNATGLLKSLDTNPAETIKHIAKITKIDLSSLIANPVHEDDDYRTPEEIATDKKLADIERKIEEFQNQKIEDSNKSIAAEINSFKEAVNEDGELKYPHFDQVKSRMAPFFDERSSLFDPEMTMARAYNKAVMLDDDLVSQRDEELLKKQRTRKAIEIEKAKKLKKFGGRSSNVSTKPASDEAAIGSIYDEWLSGNL
jgi:hypothetical protein